MNEPEPSEEQKREELNTLLTYRLMTAAMEYIPLFSKAIQLAWREDDVEKIKGLIAQARTHAANTDHYIDQLKPEELDPKVLAIADYFHEVADEFEKALNSRKE